VPKRHVKKMGKKGNWITALKKAFTTNPKEKATNVSTHTLDHQCVGLM
jgi:hypothetical protein